MKTILKLFLFGFACASVFADEAVITLDSSNFDAGIQQHSLILVEFYAPWCGHCQHLAPEYEKAAAELAAEDSPIKLAKVNADDEANRPLAERFGVRGFPTLKVFRDGQPSDYQGGRTAESIVAYMRKQAAPALTVLDSPEAVRRFAQSDKVVLVAFVSEAAGAPYEVVAATASRLRNDYPFGAAVGLSAEQAAELGAPSASGSAVLYKQFDEPRVPLEQLSSADELAAFIAAEAMPLLAEIGPDNYMKYAERQLPLVYLFVDLSQPGQRDSVVPLVHPVASSTKGRVQWVYIDSSKYGRHAERLALSGTVVPALALEVQSTGKHYAFDESATITTEAVQSWIDSFLEGTLAPTVKSEDVPADNSAPVKIVVAKNFDELVLDATKDVFVEFYAPWCGHCKKLAPLWDQLGAALSGSPNIVIAKCDATANDVDPKYEIRGFPTLKFFPAGADKTPIEYSGDRSLDDLVSFVQQHATTAVEVSADVGTDASAHEHDEL